MAHTVPDFEDLYLSERLSDVTVAINEEEPNLGRKRKRGQQFPGHGVVLMGFSSYCKAKLTTWASNDDVTSITDTRSKKKPTHDTPKHTIELTVPAGQTEVAVCLVKGMYQKQPDLSDLSQDQQLHLLLLADRFGVPKVQVAAIDALKALSSDQLQWQTALTVLSLPDSCGQQEGCKELCHKAMAKLLQKLGDLDCVWADEQLQEQLLALPHAMLLQLLQHDDTRVVNEATVVYTIDRWWLAQASAAYSSQQLCQLMQQVRMRHLSQLYISTFMMRSTVVGLCYTPGELGIACMCANPDTLAALQEGKCAELMTYPSWTAAKRPASSQEQLLQWKMPLDVFKQLVCSHLKSKASAQSFSSGLVLQGRSFTLQVAVDKYSTTTEHSSNEGVQIGLYLRVDDLAPSSACQITARLSMVAADSAILPAPAASQRCLKRNRTLQRTGYVGGGSESWGFQDFVWFGSVSDWSDIEAQLKEKKLLHADDCVLFEVKLLELL